MKRIAEFGSVIRLLSVAILLVVALAGASGNVTAGATLPSGRAFQGASWETQSSQRDDDEETPEDEEPPADEEETPEDDKDIPEDEETPADDDDLNPDWIDGGLISETEYESPLYGYAVEWDEPWVVDDYYDDPDNGDGAVTTDIEGMDSLHIWDPETSALVLIQGFESNEATTDEILEYLESPAFFETDDGEELEGEILDQDADDETIGLVYWYEIEGDTYVRYLEYIMLDGGDAYYYAAISAPLDEFEEMFATARETILVDGDESFSVMRERTVIAALEDVP